MDTHYTIKDETWNGYSIYNKTKNVSILDIQ